MDDQPITPTPNQPEGSPSPFQTPIEPTPESFPETPVAPITNQAPKPKRSKKPLLLSLLVILLIAGAGYGVYTWQHKKVNDFKVQSDFWHTQMTNLQKQLTDLQASTSTTTKTPAPTSEQAVSTTKTMYDAVVQSWGTKTMKELMNENSSWFTTSFLSAINKGGGLNTPNNNGLPLVCGGNGITVPDNVQLSIASSSDTKASVKTTFVYSGSTNASWAVNLVAKDAKWLIDSLNCSQ